mgnify:CR=1 FL=1|jgi:hypothetical protein
MPYTVKEQKQYPHPSEKVRQAAEGAVDGLESKIVTSDVASGTIVARFNKVIHGNVLGDRTQVNIEINAVSAEECRLVLEAYPLNAVGQRLMFGARKDVTRTVLNWFYAHLEHRLSQDERDRIKAQFLDK